uniref:Integrase catalytic domain-containing protein n=2 Tax=Haemonchus contortus TaxID=6289 RepID=A0A7I4YA28_HAECO
MEFDAQLIAALNTQTSLLSQLQKDSTTAIGSLAVTDSPRSVSEVPSQGNQDSPNQTSPPTPSQGIVPPLLQPIQLRRVELPTFDGDITQYHDFWSRFRTAVHDNDAFSPATKFIYWSNSLEGSAALMIQGYDPSQPDNYRLAIEALRRRYDRPQYTHHLFHHKLEQLQSSSSSASSQRDTLCQIQSFILQLNRYEDTSTSLALMKLIRKKFPKETQLEVNKLEHRSSKTWTLPELLDGLNEVIEEYEKLDDYLPAKSTSEFNIAPVSTPRSRSPTPELRYDPRTCCFCYSPHHRSTPCHHYISPGRDSPVYVAANSDEEYDDLVRHLKDPSDTQVCTTLDHSTSSSLMTVEALAVDHQTKTSTSVILLLDTGAQRSFISQDAVARLNIQVSHITPLTTVTFGAVRTTEPSGMVDVDLVDNQGRKIRLILRTKEHLTVPCSPINFTAEDRQFLQSCNIRLESLTISRAVTPDILVGIDYFWDIVTSDCPQTLPSATRKPVQILRHQAGPLETLRFNHRRLPGQRNHRRSRRTSLRQPYSLLHPSSGSDQGVLYHHQAESCLRCVIPLQGAPSLNDCLHPGPSILPDLVGILLRSRLKPILLVADVEKAFLQFSLQLNQRDATRFLWLMDPSSPPSESNIRIFRFTRVPFGITASPFLLAASILYYLRRDPDSQLNKEIEQNTYVDNILLGASTKEEAIRKYQDSKALFTSMKMNLRQFLSNSSYVNDAINIQDRMQFSTSVSLLGLQWDISKDLIRIPIRTLRKEVISKRTALKAYASTFDPLGILSPFLAPFKIFLQDMWIKSYQWDEPFEDADIARWKKLAEDLAHPIPSVPRCLVPSADSPVDYELCVFGDASKRLYASCVYLRCRSLSSTTIHLLMAKSLPGPRNPITMPRMELLATLISLRLIHFVHTQLRLKISAVHVFSDSQIVLHWIHSTRSLRTFVRNGIMEIRVIVDKFRDAHIPLRFYYVQSQYNPADCASRGIPTSHARHHFWWSGPSFLRLPSSRWPGTQDFATPPANDNEVQDEYQTLALSTISQYTSPFRFRSVSRYTRLVRSTVYALKFIAHVATNIKATLRSFDVTPFNLTKDVTASEFAVAEALLIKEHYRECENILSRMPLSRFNAHRSADGLIRCPHRMEHAYSSASSAILLVPFHPLTTLIIRHTHLSQFHSGIHATIATLRHSYLIPAIKSTVSKVLRLCVICKKINGLPYRYPDMPSLPPEKVQRPRPFQNIALDYFGPLRYKDITTTSSKVWISLFTCMATRAIHLEIVMDNSTQEFLCALRRFIARRGVPTLILSDNATTFCAADNTLQELISNYSSSRHIQWKFTTPLSPWKGGFYERLVGLVKSSFRKSIGRSLLPLPQFQTIICEIEAIINSRPIASISDTTSSPTILRPIDFISPQAHLQLELTDTTRYEQSQHQLVEWHQSTLSVLDHFWNIWSQDYLNAIAQRHTSRVRQGRTTTREPRVGEVVLLADKQLPRGQWTPAVITYINYNHDRVPRSATIRLPNGNHIKRSINHLYPLELSAAESPSDTVIEKSTPPRIQPTRSAKSAHRYIKPRDTVQSNN